MRRNAAPPAEAQYQGLAAFRLALRHFLAFSDVATKSARVTGQQYQAMLVIRTQAGGAIQIKDLADQLLIQHNGAVQLVNRLVDAGLVERRSAPSDGRGVLVVLTHSGSVTLAKLAQVHLSELLRHERLLADSLSRLRRITRSYSDASGR